MSETTEWADAEKETIKSITQAGLDGRLLAMDDKQAHEFFAHLRAAQALVIASALMRRSEVVNIVRGLVVVK